MVPRKVEKFDSMCVITRKDHKYTINEVEDELLSRRQLVVLLHKALGVDVVELAFMFEDFKQHPERNEAHFGLNGFYLFSR